MRHPRARYFVPITLILMLLLATVVGAGCGKSETPPDEPAAPVTTQPGTSTGPTTPPPTTPPEPKPAEETAVNPLTGLEVPSEALATRPFLVSIDNHVAARPQSGLSRADLVYEVPVEGGITRFIGVFWTDDDIAKIGPVRSARHYFLDLVIETQGILAHAGGSPQYYAEAPRVGIADLDDIKGASAGGVNAFWRDNERKMPHNLYTNRERLDTVAKARGYFDTDFEVRPMFDFRAENEQARGADVDKITIHVPGYVSYDITYQYSPSGKYLRFSGAKEHRDDLDGQQLRASNVIVQLVPVSLIRDDPDGRLNVDLTGSGTAYVFTDGKFIEAQWEHKSRSARTQFVDEAGNLVRLTPGQTHILIMPVNTEFEGLPES